MKSIAQSWNRFWFSPADPSAVALVRVAICCLTAVWFCSFLPQAAVWFGADGILSTQLAGQIIAFEEISRRQKWSPLWWFDSLLAHQVWLCAGALLAVLSAAKIGGRVTIAILLCWSIAWTHRILWLTGPIEPALVAMLAYLIVEPGARLPWPQLSGRQLQSANLLLRLIQVHTWLLLAATALSQLAGVVWWRGDAAWWLAASGRSYLLNLEMFSDRAWLVNLVTHAMIALELVTLWLLTTGAARKAGVILGWLGCLAIALVADQLLYGALLAVGLLAFWVHPKDS